MRIAYLIAGTYNSVGLERVLANKANYLVARGGISIYPYCNYGRPGTKYEELAEYRMRNHDL